MYINELIGRWPTLDFMHTAMRNAVASMERCYRTGCKILLCGNGGSAADAEHIVGELMKGFMLKRPIPAELRQKLIQNGLAEEEVDKLQMGIPAISLVAGVALPTAFANDVAGEYIFAQQVLNLGKKGDIFFAISTSGKSPNVVAAAKTARAKEISVISLTGNRTANLLSELADIRLEAPSGETRLIQEFHLAIYHALCAQLEYRLFGEEQ